MSFVTFGEIMLRLTPALHREKLQTTSQFDVNFAGSESNVASSLGVLGNNVSFVTKLPKNAIGDNAIRSLRKYGISTEDIVRGGDRIGTYFIEIGASIRPSSVVYDRKYGAFSEISENEFIWKNIFKGKEYLFVSGITAALSPQCAKELIKCVESAKKHGVKVAFDMNYRRTLWDNHKDAQYIFDQILPNTDILFGNAGVLSDVYEITSDKEDKVEASIDVIAQAKEKFGIEEYIFTVRHHHSASVNKVEGIYVDKNDTFISNAYTVEILDRFGTGDAFAASCLHSLGQGKSAQDVVNFGTAAFALKHTIYGDQHTSTEEEILSVVNGETSGHVKR